ncbi:hypothetical protein BAE44_0020526 [Dichanthelium oligosanthes]|uniref:F-box domain-containing protein n=1 Tax=Dichanthelium oligosanthes TaxID=888268 RepID=A0A1E5UZW7_9POAL|nr:hypothetical protein BAE44_0020526 [Dichanthelium oligosanthes]
MMDCPSGSSPPLNLQQSQDEDRISGLPDHILLDILERLDLHEAIRASTLSRRWAQLPHLLSCLLIDVAHFLPRDAHKRKTCTVDQIMTAYTAAVRRLLPSSSTSSDHRATIKQLQLSFYLTDPYLCSIGHAVGDVMELGNTTYLEFTIWADIRRPSYDQTVLYGERFMSFFRDCPKAFRWLTRLILDNITFGDSDLNSFLNTCSNLQFLSLRYCDSAFDLVTGEDTVLKIDAPHSALLVLEMHTCGFARVDLIQAPKLGRLVCTAWAGANPPLTFGNLPCLDNITLCSAAKEWHTPFPLSQCFSNTTNLSIMYLNFADQMVWIEPEDPKHLSRALNNLREVSRHPCESSRCENSAKKVNVLWHQASPEFKHRKLSLLEIIGFAVDEKLMKYIRHVMERAVGLKRIRLLDQPPCSKCDAIDDAQLPSHIRWRFPEEKEERKLIKQQLIDGFSSCIEISIG